MFHRRAHRYLYIPWAAHRISRYSKHNIRHRLPLEGRPAQRPQCLYANTRGLLASPLFLQGGPQRIFPRYPQYFRITDPFRHGLNRRASAGVIKGQKANGIRANHIQQFQALYHFSPHSLTTALPLVT